MNDKRGFAHPNIQNIAGNEHQIAAHNNIHIRGSDRSDTTGITNAPIPKGYVSRMSENKTAALARIRKTATKKTVSNIIYTIIEGTYIIKAVT
jgi:hypothetical protein